MRKFLPIFLAFFLGVFVVGIAGFIYAQSVSDLNIYSCVNSRGQIRIINSSETCLSNETPLSWRKGPEPGTEFPFIFSGTLPGIGNRLAGRNLQNAIIAAHIETANLTNINFTNATLAGSLIIKHTNFSNSNFTNADLEAILVTSNFSGANLTGANLQNAMIGFVNFSNANLTNANLNGSFICSDQPNDPEPVTQPFPDASLPILTGAMWSNTTCPDGTNSDSNGGTCEGHFTVVNSCTY